MTIKIDADAFFRAITSVDFKLMMYYFDLDTGEIVARARRPDEVIASPEAPSVKPLPKLGDDLTLPKKAPPFEPVPGVKLKKKLFDDADSLKKSSFAADFWKCDKKENLKLFEEDFKRVSGSRKLAEIFSESDSRKVADTPPQYQLAPATSGITANDSRHPRIPVASEADQIEWIRAFARDFGDPQIRDEMYAALNSAKHMISFDKVLRKHQRMSQQWERHFRKTALAYGEAWLSNLGIQWELIES